MSHSANSHTIMQLEEQLAALEPMPDDVLAEKILQAAETAHLPVSLPTHTFSQAVQPTQHASCFASSLPILTGIAGGLIGAAIMFFAVTFFMPPRVEFREVVRYVQQEVPVVVPVETQPEITPSKPKPAEHPPRSQPQESRELPWVLAWLSPVLMRDTTADLRAADLMHDLDAMIEQRAKLARNSANMEPRPQFVRFERNNSQPSEFSPINYREMMEKMSL